MPNSFLPPVEQGGPHSKEGIILLGDAWNMRHPLTGGGMTVALSDVVLLAPMIAAEPNLTDWHALTDILHRWHWARKPLASTINILSVALYDLFGADGEYTCPPPTRWGLAHRGWHKPLMFLCHIGVLRRVTWSSADRMLQVLRARRGMHPRSSLVALGVSLYHPLAESRLLMILLSPEHHEKS